MKKLNGKNAAVATDLLIIMQSNLTWEYEGFALDGQGELFLTQMKEYLDDMLAEAYKIGYLKNEQSKNVIEAKHIKFLGNDVINEMKEMAMMLVSMTVK